MNRSTLVHLAAAVLVASFAGTGARAADDTYRVASSSPAGAPAAGYRLSDWSGWSRAAGIEYRYRWGWNPQDSRYATRVDAIVQVRNRQAQAWQGSARSLECERNTVAMGTRVVLQANETKEVKFMTPNCGSRTSPSFRPNVVKSVRID